MQHSEYIKITKLFDHIQDLFSYLELYLSTNISLIFYLILSYVHKYSKKMSNNYIVLRLHSMVTTTMTKGYQSDSLVYIMVQITFVLHRSFFQSFFQFISDGNWLSEKL